MSQDTIKKLRGLIVFAVAVVVAGVNYRQVFAAAMTLLGMLAPFLAGGAMAFALNVPMRWFEHHLKRGRLKRWSRGISLVLSLICVLGILFVVMMVVAPELLRTVVSLEKRIPLFIMGVQKELERLFASYPQIVEWIESVEINWDDAFRQAAAFLTDGASTVLSTTVSAAVSIASGMASLGIGFVFSIYILLQKETLARQATKVLYAFFKKKDAEFLVRVARLTEKTFSSFLTGQCVEAVILGSMFFVALSLLGMPYALLIGVLIAFTALIPIFGAMVGCVVGVFLILIVNPWQALGFIAVFLLLQQIEGNLIYPHVVGNSVGLPSIWVLVAVTLGGSMLGIVGMLVFIPLVSVLYTLFGEWVNKRITE